MGEVIISVVVLSAVIGWSMGAWIMPYFDKKWEQRKRKLKDNSEIEKLRKEVDEVKRQHKFDLNQLRIELNLEDVKRRQKEINALSTKSSNYEYIEVESEHGKGYLVRENN